MKRLLTALLLLLIPHFLSTLGYSQNPAAVIRFGPTLPATCQPAGPNIFFKTAATVGLYQCTTPNTWVLLDSGGAVGDVSGPISSVDNALPRFDGITGKLLQSSLITLDDTGILSFPDGIKQTFNPSATTAGLNVGSNAGDPSALADGDLWYDSVAGALRARIAGTSISVGAGGGIPTQITVAVSGDTTSSIAFFESPTGDLAPKTAAGLTFNATTGALTATSFIGPLTGAVTGNVTGNVTGTAATVTTAAQPNITSLGTLTILQVDNLNIDGNTLSSTAGVDLLITPLAGQQLILDGTIIVDAGVVTGITDLTLTNLTISGTCTGCPGAGSIGGATGSLDNAILRADGVGGSTLQSSLVTIDDITGDLHTPGDISLGEGSSEAGGTFWGVGTAQSLVANSWGWFAGTSAPAGGAAYRPPATSGTGVMFVTNNSDVHDITHEAVTGTGNFVRSANPTLTGTTTLANAAVTTSFTVAGAAVTNNVVQNSQSAAYTTVLSDAGKQILHPTSDNNARTFTIDSNANVPYAIGTCITFINQINTITISINADTLILAGTGTTGSRTLAANGIATAIKITTTIWLINGTGLT